METPKQIHILLVEDDRMVAKLLIRILTIKGLLMDHAENGNEALEMLRHGAGFDVLLTDMNLPDMSGQKVVTLAQQRYPHIRIVVFSGSPLPNAEDALWKNVRMLQKPMLITELMAAIQQIC